MSEKLKIGSVVIGGGEPVAVQSMTCAKSADIDGNIDQIKRLYTAGCRIVRVAVPDMAASKAIEKYKLASPMPVVADIHFDYKLALSAIEHGADKIRLNPGNIGSLENVKAVAEACRRADIPIRVGVNGGSISKEVRQRFGGATPDALFFSAMEQVRSLEQLDFANICVAVKSSNVPVMVKAAKMLAQACDHPLHLGVTEAGNGADALIKSAVGIGSLLLDGVGDTIRVSLTDDPVHEVEAAYSILSACGFYKKGVEIVSCPTCGRCRADMFRLLGDVREKLRYCPHNIKVAVMGCVVNGPGEASDADCGLACGDGKAALFLKGKVISSVDIEYAADALTDAVKSEFGEFQKC